MPWGRKSSTNTEQETKRVRTFRERLAELRAKRKALIGERTKRKPSAASAARIGGLARGTSELEAARIAREKREREAKRND